MPSSTSFQRIQSLRFPFRVTDPCFIDSKVETLLDGVKWDEKGLAVAIAQNVDTGAILMQGFVNRDAIATTILTKKATFYSFTVVHVLLCGLRGRLLTISSMFMTSFLIVIVTREEADELCRTLEENEENSRVASEMGDVLYYAMVLLSLKGVKVEDVFEVLRRRLSLV